MIVRMKRLTLLCLTARPRRGAGRAARARRGARHRQAPAGRRGARGAARPARRRGAGAGRAAGEADARPPRPRRGRRDRGAARCRPRTPSRRCSRCSTAATRSPPAPGSSAGSWPGTPASASSTWTRCASSQRAGVWTALAVRAAGRAPHGAGRRGAHGARPRPRRRGASCSPSLGGRPEPPARPRGPLRARPLARAPARRRCATRSRRPRPSRTRRPRRLDELAAARGAVAALVRATADQTRWAEVRAGMDEAGELSVLSGYVPADEQDAVREAAAAHGWGILLDDPQPGEDVPIQLHQSRWVRPISTVFDFLHIYPGYWEADAGWVILPFFSLFFAMIVGDAGYAALLLVAHRGAAVAPQEGAGARVPHDVHRRLRDARLGRALRQLLRHPDAAAVRAAAPGGLARRPRQPHRPLLPHRRGAPLVRPRLERGVVRPREGLDQGGRAGRLAARRVVDVLHRPLGRPRPRRSGLPAADAARRRRRSWRRS